MKNNYCNLSEEELRKMEIPPLAVGLLTSPFQHCIQAGGMVAIPLDTFQQFTDCVTDYVRKHNPEIKVPFPPSDDTPLVDGNVEWINGNPYVCASFARYLERRMNDATSKAASSPPITALKFLRGRFFECK